MLGDIGKHVNKCYIIKMRRKMREGRGGRTERRTERRRTERRRTERRRRSTEDGEEEDEETEVIVFTETKNIRSS